MRAASHPVIAGCCLLAAVLLLGGCGNGDQDKPAGEAGGAGQLVVALLPAVQGGVDAEAVAGVVASIRHRLGRVGFEEVSVNALPDDELLVRFSASPASDSPRIIMDKAFENCGVLELRRMHPDSEILVGSLKRLSQAGPGWWVAQGSDGLRCVVAEEVLLGSEQVIGVEAVASSTGSGLDVLVTVDARASRLVTDLKAEIGLQPLALLLDGRVAAAPVAARSLAGDTIVVARGVSQARARELVFVLEAPLLVPLQTKG